MAGRVTRVYDFIPLKQGLKHAHIGVGDSTVAFGL